MSEKINLRIRNDYKNFRKIFLTDWLHVDLTISRDMVFFKIDIITVSLIEISINFNYLYLALGFFGIVFIVENKELTEHLKKFE